MIFEEYCVVFCACHVCVGILLCQSLWYILGTSEVRGDWLFVRVFALSLFATLSFQDPWFGFEQEYYLIDPKTKWPLGWPKGRYPDKDTDTWQNDQRT